MNTLAPWAQAHPLAAVAVGSVLLAVIGLSLRPLRRTPAAVTVASLAAMACTAYSGDTSWGFAEHQLHMTSTAERGAMFAAAELALFSCALMARQNLNEQGAPGTPGVLVWVITGVQVIPAYSESGLVGGTVRAVVGPVMAALLWHLAMGIELRHAKPGTDSASLPALIARELRERVLSYLGLATRDRTAEQITRDRWTVKAVGLAAKLAGLKPSDRSRARVARRLSVAVGKAQAGASEDQRHKLLDLLAARRHAVSLATIDLPSPWEDSPEDARDIEDADASPSVPPYPNPVPPGVRLLPITARPLPTVTLERDTPQDATGTPELPPGMSEDAEDAEDAEDGPRPEPPLMTSNDVADHYGIKPSTVRNWVALGRIPVHSKDAAGRNLFHPSQLPNFQVGVPA